MKGLAETIGDSGASLEERVTIKEHRQPQDILIKILEFLRREGEANKNLISSNIQLYIGQLPPYLDYLIKKGLIRIEKTTHRHRVTLTEEGKNMPLQPEQFLDFSYGDRRTGMQLQYAIADAVHRHGGAATRYQIMRLAGIGSREAGAYLDKLLEEGYLIKTTAGTGIRPKEMYHLTPKGISKFPDVGDKKSSNECIARGKGDNLARLLEAAQHGANKTRLSNSIGSNTIQIEQYIACLIEYGLLVQSDGKFFSTPLYKQMDKAVLPYALEIISTGKRRTPRLLEVDFLLAMPEPVFTTYINSRFGTQWSSSYNHVLESLVEQGYAARYRGVKGRGGGTMYQITPEGKSFIAKVKDNLAILANAVHRPLSYNTISVMPAPS